MNVQEFVAAWRAEKASLVIQYLEGGEATKVGALIGQMQLVDHQRSLMHSVKDDWRVPIDTPAPERHNRRPRTAAEASKSRANRP
jgi:hypothetical protein